MQPVINYLVPKTPFLGPVYTYEKQKKPINEKIKLLTAIKKSYEKSLANPNPKTMNHETISSFRVRISEIDKKLEKLKLKLQKEKIVSVVSVIGSGVGLASNFFIPGSGPVVGLGSTVARSYVHNSFSEDIGEEKRSLVQEGAKNIAITTGRGLLKTAITENCSIM